MKKIFINLFITLTIVTSCIFTTSAQMTEKMILDNFANYDNLMRKRSEGPLNSADSVSMLVYLKEALDNYNSLKKDSAVPISEELAQAFARHYPDYTVAGIFMFQSNEFKNAYEIWGGCVDVPDDPIIDNLIENRQNSRGQLAYNRALAAIQAGMGAEALSSYEKAFELGYFDNQLFDSAIMLSEQQKDFASASKWAKRGIEKNGESSIYKDYLIKYKISENPEEALIICTETIGLDPKNPRWYNRRMEANEKLHNHEAVLVDMKIVTELAPNDPVTFANYGLKMIFVANMAKYENAASKEDLKKMYDEGTKALEHALELAKAEQKNMPAIAKSLNALDKYYHEIGDNGGKKRVVEFRKKFGFIK